jgi:hypothetical protein
MFEFRDPTGSGGGLVFIETLVIKVDEYSGPIGLFAGFRKAIHNRLHGLLVDDLNQSRRLVRPLAGRGDVEPAVIW